MGQQVERECPVCHVTYTADATRLGHGRQTTCSRRCSYDLRAQQLERRVDGVCATCGQEFTRPPSHVKGKHGSVFCSRACHYAGRSLGLTRRVVTEPYRYPQASIAALSQAAARAYATGTTLPHPQTEVAAKALLARHGIAFVHQYVVTLPNGKAVVLDFYLPRRRVCIEVDAPDQHGRKAARHRDAERNAALANLGITVLRVHDDGVPEHVARAVLLAAVGE
jgi:very-short-patch-repair endonuclease